MSCSDYESSPHRLRIYAWMSPVPSSELLHGLPLPLKTIPLFLGLQAATFIERLVLTWMSIIAF